MRGSLRGPDAVVANQKRFAAKVILFNEISSLFVANLGRSFLGVNAHVFSEEKYR